MRIKSGQFVRKENVFKKNTEMRTKNQGQTNIAYGYKICLKNRC